MVAACAPLALELDAACALPCDDAARPARCGAARDAMWAACAATARDASEGDSAVLALAAAAATLHAPGSSEGARVAALAQLAHAAPAPPPPEVLLLLADAASGVKAPFCSADWPPASFAAAAARAALATALQRTPTLRRDTGAALLTAVAGSPACEWRTDTLRALAAGLHPPGAPPPSDEELAAPAHLVVVGDLHGQLTKTRQLWRRLERHIGTHAFAHAKIIFLGDYCDKGPDTRGVIEWLSSLPAAHPAQQHVFLVGNHDFSMASFLGLVAGVDGAASDAHAAAHNPWRSGELPLYTGPGAAGMHLQGRRWANAGEDKLYFSDRTFESYGVEFGDRGGLLAALPEAHKAFLRGLDFAHECALPLACAFTPLACATAVAEGGQGARVEEEPARRLVALHAGLDEREGMDAQLARMAARDACASRLEQHSGRAHVFKAHPEAASRRTVCVSGHHSVLQLSAWRLIVDSGAGEDCNPITAVIFPGRVQVQSD
jgi:hypothetical protein